MTTLAAEKPNLKTPGADLSGNELVPIKADERVSEIASRSQMNSARGVSVETLPEAVEFAKIMCQAAQAIPKAFRGNPGMCLAVTMQSLRWGFDPFGVAQNAYVVNDKVAYEAKLMVAAINANAGLAEPLDYQYEGSGDDVFCRVIGRLYRRDGEIIKRIYETPPIGGITPKNSPLWKNDPKQQLAYFGARAWARRFTPEVLLGVYGRDEIQDTGSVINATRPTAKPTIGDRFRNAEALPPSADATDKENAGDDERPARDINEDSGEGAAASDAAPEEGAVETPAEQPGDPAPSSDDDDDTFPGDLPSGQSAKHEG